MRNDILFGIVITLLNEGRRSNTYLSKKFEVSTKTISRYLLYLEMSGVPTRSYMGKYGGTEIVGTFSLDNLFFTKDELSRIFLHLQSSPFSKIDKIDNQIEDKLIFQLNAEKVNLPESSIYVDNNCWSGESISKDHINTLLLSIKSKLSLNITYNSTTTGYSERTISPMLLINKECKWYCLAYCHNAKSLRLFKISRIEKLSLTATTYSTPNITKEMALQLISNSFRKTNIKLETTSVLLQDLKEWLNINKLEKVQDDNVQIEGQVINNNGLLYKLIAYGDKVKVISPDEIRNKLIATCKAIEKRYQVN